MISNNVGNPQIFFHDITSSKITNILRKYFHEVPENYNYECYATEYQDSWKNNLKKSLPDLIETQIKVDFDQKISRLQFLTKSLPIIINDACLKLLNIETKDYLFIFYDYNFEYRYPGKDVDLLIKDFNLNFITLKQLKNLLEHCQKDLERATKIVLQFDIDKFN